MTVYTYQSRRDGHVRLTIGPAPAIPRDGFKVERVDLMSGGNGKDKDKPNPEPPKPSTPDPPPADPNKGKRGNGR